MHVAWWCAKLQGRFNRGSPALTEMVSEVFYQVQFHGDPIDSPVQINLSIVNLAGTEVCVQLYYTPNEGLLCKMALALQQFLIVAVKRGFISTKLLISHESTETPCLRSSVCIGRDLQGCSGQLCMVWKVLKVVFWCPSWTVLMISMHTLQN